MWPAMSNGTRAGRLRAGAGGAVAGALLQAAGVGLVLARLMHAARGAMPADDAMRALSLAAAGVSALAAAALLVAAWGVREALRPPSIVTRLAFAGAVAGAGLLLASAVATILEATAGVAGGRAAALCGELAPVGQGVWALAASAAAWRLKRWPAWVRVVGAIYGAAAMVQPGAPVFAGVALLAGLAWGLGLGFGLWRDGRNSTPG